MVKVEDLPKNSSKITVRVQCDYCGKIIPKIYQALIKERERSPVNKDCCYDCRHLKVEESNLLVYGVKSTNSLESVIEKRKSTNIEKYGVDNVMKNGAIKEKVGKTNLRKYGEIAPCKNKEVKKKLIMTNIKKYGFASPTLNKKIREKQLKTMTIKYGEQYPMKLDFVKEKSKKSMYENDTAPCSKSQRKVYEYIGGELNYPIGYYSLDIAFPEEMIYIECDFSGHWLRVKLGHMTEEEWKSYELKRWYFLYRRGWKEIRIVSKKDYLPSKDDLIKLIDYSKSLLNEVSSVIINFDDNLIETKGNEVSIDTIL